MASIATTVDCEPYFLDISVMRPGFFTACVLMLTLSAPDLNMWSASARLLIPPPTVIGMDISLATDLTTSLRISLPFHDALISRKTISSAPSASYLTASSTGSPTTARSLNLLPLTTLPSSTSRHGITLTTMARYTQDVLYRYQPLVKCSPDNNTSESKIPYCLEITNAPNPSRNYYHASVALIYRLQGLYI